MTRALLPSDARAWLELGTSRPSHVAFEARIPFSVCWAVTDGKKQYSYLWITRRKTGVYVASATEGGSHHSYHSNGHQHIKSGRGKVMNLASGPPLDQIRGYVSLGTRSSSIATEALEAIGGRFPTRPANKVILLDNRLFGPWVYSHIYLVEPFRHGEVPLGIDHPSFVYVVTHTVPWFVVVIADGSAA
jgi:hypothetical protein